MISTIRKIHAWTQNNIKIFCKTQRSVAFSKSCMTYFQQLRNLLSFDSSFWHFWRRNKLCGSIIFLQNSLLLKSIILWFYLSGSKMMGHRAHILETICSGETWWKKYLKKKLKGTLILEGYYTTSVEV